LRVLLLFSLLLLSPSVYSTGFQQLLQLIDYVGVDYEEAVDQGKIVNQGEYQEMQDFTLGITEKINSLPDDQYKADLLSRSRELASLINHKADADEIRKLTATMRATIVNNYDVVTIPQTRPDLKQGAQLYSTHCASCHGANGNGKGPLADGMQPPPIDFLDKERYAQRTLHGLYNTITQGVPGTTMKPYEDLGNEDRWGLAFYVGQLAIDKSAVAHAENDAESPALAPLLDIKKFTITTPSEAELEFGSQGAMVMAWLRSDPSSLFNTGSPLEFSQRQLDEVGKAYSNGQFDEAYRLAVEAYLEGFELIEQSLDTVDSDLRLEIEQAMTGLRNMIRKRAPVDEVESDIEHINGLLEAASSRLSENNLSGSAAFVSAFFILLREGLEALLVVAALVAFLAKTGHRENVRYLHTGWIGALLAGFLTWWASQTIVNISGASREVTEGVAALIAAGVLFYVGFWLHDKTTAAQWKTFIEKSMNKALTTGTLWGLSGLSFIAVYREVFETILFYQALWVQTDEAGKSMALGGMAAGVSVLAILALMVFRYSMRLPLRQFFSISGILMFVLALIFTGKGIAALQEAGYLPITPVGMPHIDLLGIYPNLQGLLAQLALLLVALYLWYGPSRIRST